MKRLLMLVLLFQCSAVFGQHTINALPKPDSVWFFLEDFKGDTSLYGKPLLNYKTNPFELGKLELEKGKTIAISARRPLKIFNDRGVLVFPGEHISVIVDSQSVYHYKVSGNEQRNRDFAFAEVYGQELRRIYNDLSERRRLAILKQDSTGIRVPDFKVSKDERGKIFDSLVKVYNPSEVIVTINKNQEQYSQIVQDAQNFWIYKDSLEKSGLAKTRMDGLLEQVNRVTDPDVFWYDLDYSLMNIAKYFLSREILAPQTVGEFDASAAAISKLFNKPASELLISRLMYNWVYRKKNISPELWSSYLKWSANENLSNAIADANMEELKKQEVANPYGPNGLYTLSNEKMTNLESVIAKHKGRLILLDFWASWCVPCIKAFPAGKELETKLVGEDIVFLKISIDRDADFWKQANERYEVDANFSYCFINTDRSTFVNKYSINAIPRYMVIDKKGNVVDDKAPDPDDPGLEKLIKKYL